MILFRLIYLGGVLTIVSPCVYRFHARDLHLVLGPAADGKPVRFRVMIDGALDPGVRAYAFTFG